MQQIKEKITEAKELLLQAESLFESGDFDAAEELAEEAKDLAAESRMKYLGKTAEDLSDDKQSKKDEKLAKAQEKRDEKLIKAQEKRDEKQARHAEKFAEREAKLIEKAQFSEQRANKIIEELEQKIQKMEERIQKLLDKYESGRKI
jgi:hypothetical protein